MERPQDGKFYNKWLSYGQSKTANMLMAISLPEKLGTKYKLSAFSINPGLVISNLGAHLKLFGESDVDLISMRKSYHFYAQIHYNYKVY